MITCIRFGSDLNLHYVLLKIRLDDTFNLKVDACREVFNPIHLSVTTNHYSYLTVLHSIFFFYCINKDL